MEMKRNRERSSSSRESSRLHRKHSRRNTERSISCKKRRRERSISRRERSSHKEYSRHNRERSISWEHRSRMEHGANSMEHSSNRERINHGFGSDSHCNTHGNSNVSSCKCENSTDSIEDNQRSYKHSNLIDTFCSHDSYKVGKYVNNVSSNYVDLVNNKKILPVRSPSNSQCTSILPKENKRKFASEKETVEKKKQTRSYSNRYVEIRKRSTPKIINDDTMLSKPELKVNAVQRRKLSIRLQTVSLKIENKLLRNKQISTKMLTKEVVISDKTTHSLYKGKIVRCEYINDKEKDVFWRITISSNIDMTVDTDTMIDIFEQTLKKDYEVFDISKVSKIAHNDCYIESSYPRNEITNQEFVCSGGIESEVCVFCGIDSKQLRKDPNLITRYIGNKLGGKDCHLDHITCSKCQSKCCVSCVTALCQVIKKNKDHIEDKWYKDVSEILSNGKDSRSFIGHCCEVKEAIKKEKKRRLSLQVLLNKDTMVIYIYHNSMYYLIPH